MARSWHPLLTPDGSVPPVAVDGGHFAYTYAQLDRIETALEAAEELIAWAERGGCKGGVVAAAREAMEVST